MKKTFLFICMLLIVTVSLSITPVIVNAETSDEILTGEQLKDEFVGNLTCGNSDNDTQVVRFHENLPIFTSRLYDFLKILTPVIIIITGMIDIVKAVTAQKEDDIKKAQKTLVNRLIAGAVVFLVFTIVETVINFVAADESNNIADCLNCFLDGKIGEDGCVPAPERN